MVAWDWEQDIKRENAPALDPAFILRLMDIQRGMCGQPQCKCLLAYEPTPPSIGRPKSQHDPMVSVQQVSLMN